MKLSEMNTRELAKALCGLTMPISNICKDAEVVEALKTMQEKRTIADMLASIVPVLLDKHYDDTVAVLSALTGKTVQQINAQKGSETITDIKMCLDGDLVSFFSSSAPTEKTPS